MQRGITIIHGYELVNKPPYCVNATEAKDLVVSIGWLSCTSFQYSQHFAMGNTNFIGEEEGWYYANVHRLS